MYRLLDPKFPLLPTLAAHVPFETAIGLNGRVWLKSGSVGETIALKRVIEDVDEGRLALDKEKLAKAVKAYMA
jgi:exosome complex component RRP40